MVRVYAFIAVLVLAGLMYLFVRELSVISNMLDKSRFVLNAIIGGLLLFLVVFLKIKSKLSPFKRHLPEIISLFIGAVFFSPLWTSWVNRAFVPAEYQPFFFVSEQAFYSRPYGLLPTDPRLPDYWLLRVSENGKIQEIKSKKQPYFPLSKPGDQVELPVKQGWLGVRVVDLE